MNDESTLLAAVAQGQIDALVRSGVFKWQLEQPYDRILKACQLIHLRGQQVTVLSIHSECSLTAEEWTPIWELWKEAKSSPKIDWRPAAARIINRCMREQGILAAGDLEQTLENSGDPKQAIATAVTRLSTLVDNGSMYNPTPSFHYREGVMGDVMGSTGLKSLDKLLRGGFWTQALIGYAAPSNHGKSTLAYTLLAQCVRLKRKCQLFTFETDTPRAVARVLSSLTGIPLSDAIKRHGSSEANQALIDSGLNEIDKYFSVYDSTFNDPEKMEQAVRLERPVLSCVDHITMPSPKMMRRPNMGDQIGDLCDLALQWTIKYSFTMLLNSQLDNEMQLELKKTHNLMHTKMFGSSRIYNAMDFVVVGLRHWSIPNAGYFRLKKNRKDGILDIDTCLYHNPLTQTYEELP